MFVTHPTFEFDAPEILRTPEARYYRAMQLTARLPWFLLTINVDEDGWSRLQSVCCYWDNDLIELLKSVEGGTFAALQFVDSSPEPRNEWRMRSLEYVWLARDTASEETVLIFRDSEGNEFEGQFARPLKNTFVERQLVASVGSKRACG